MFGTTGIGWFSVWRLAFGVFLKKASLFLLFLAKRSRVPINSWQTG
jgi:hypothetical protein